MSDVPTLRNGDVTLRPFALADADVLGPALDDWSIRQWWTPASTDLMPDDLINDGNAFTVEVGGEVAGWIGFENDFEPAWQRASLDIFLVRTFQGRRLGARALSAALDWLLNVVGHQSVTIDPSVDNHRAIAVYESVGFKPVGVLRLHEQGPDGVFHDALLMDVIASELRPH